MEQIAEVYSRALFQVALEKGSLDALRDELGTFDDALTENKDLKTFFTSPEFSTEEKKDGLHRSVTGASEEITNFLEALLERHRMAAIHRIRSRLMNAGSVRGRFLRSRSLVQLNSTRTP